MPKSFLLAALLLAPAAALAVEPRCPGGASPDPAVLFCEDYDSGQSLYSRFAEYRDADGSFAIAAGEGLEGSHAMAVTFQPGQVDGGWLMRTFGRTPPGFYAPQSHGTRDFREIYWREYVRMGPGWSGHPRKLSRVHGIADGKRAQSMIAHVWNDDADPHLFTEPASGIGTDDTLITTGYNDFANLRWLGGPNAIDPGWSGSGRGTTPVYAAASADTWFCVESHAKLNTPGQADGVQETWVDGKLESRYEGLNWVGTWQDYGINALNLENYWNGGSPQTNVRYRDNLVVSEERIGCLPPARQRPGTRPA